MAAKQIDIAEAARFVELRSGGLSFTSTAAAMGISKGKALELGRELAKEVGIAVGLRRQEIIEMAKVGGGLRAAAYAETLAAVLEELRARVTAGALATVPVQTLLAMSLNLEMRLRQEEKPVVVQMGWQSALDDDGANILCAMD